LVLNFQYKYLKMKRRDFLKATSLAIALGAVNPLKVFSSVAGKMKSDSSFSLEVITSNPDYAASLLEDFAKSGNLGIGEMKYSEYPVVGDVMGDLVFVNDNKLIDYITASDEVSVKLREIRKQLRLPSVIENPVRIRLYKNANTDVNNLFVVQKGNIIKKINPEISDIYNFYGKSGKLVLNVSKGNAYVLESECRHQICKRTGSIKNSGDYITCIPNQLHIFAE